MDEYYNHVVAICKKRNLYQPLSTNLKKMKKQRQDVDVDAVRFLLGLKPEFESVHAQILGGSELPTLLELFSQIQRATLTDHGPQMSYEHTGEHVLLLLLPVAISVGIVVVKVVMFFMVAMTLEAVVDLVVVSIANVLTMAILVTQ